ncbi:MAG: hypothetical protein HRT47_13920 [Candidatus Caenarcaniphilales bacterium]|nr:hypothetical protein [Candidatus Caenarcaniphilales bacterium]
MKNLGQKLITNVVLPGAVATAALSSGNSAEAATLHRNTDLEAFAEPVEEVYDFSGESDRKVGQLLSGGIKEDLAFNLIPPLTSLEEILSLDSVVLPDIPKSADIQSTPSVNLTPKTSEETLYFEDSVAPSFPLTDYTKFKGGKNPSLGGYSDQVGHDLPLKGKVGHDLPLNGNFNEISPNLKLNPTGFDNNPSHMKRK